MNGFLRTALALTTAGVLLAGCGIREASIAMPAHLVAQTDRLELRGMGGGTRGGFRLDGIAGEFTRSASRTGIFDPLLVRRTGGGTFRLGASHLGPDLSGRCRYGEATMNAGPISLNPGRLSYECEFFRYGRPIDAEMFLEDPKSAFGTLHGRDKRRGLLLFEDLEIEVLSVHHDQGGGLPNATALGYIFSLEGTEIGAIDLNGTTKMIHAPREPRLREAVLAASLALSVFWDPAIVWSDD